MTLLSYSAEVNRRAKAPRFNTDPALLFENGKAPSGRKGYMPVAIASREATVTSASATVTMTDTSGISVGDLVMGAGVSAGQAATTQDTGDTFTITAHGAPNGTPFYLTALATTTGVAINTLYYVVGTAANTFQAALTPGGSAVALTTNGTATVVFRRFVSAVTTDTSVTLNFVASASATDTNLKFMSPAVAIN
jgi:hypothetical protein